MRVYVLGRLTTHVPPGWSNTPCRPHESAYWWLTAWSWGPAARSRRVPAARGRRVPGRLLPDVGVLLPDAAWGGRLPAALAAAGRPLVLDPWVQFLTLDGVGGWLRGSVRS